MSVTPSQTVGPYFQIGLIDERWTQMATGSGERITIEGTVFDAEGNPVTDAMVEIWQPNCGAFGRFAVDPASGRSFGELPAEAKNAFSHRRRALDALRAQFRRA